MNILVVEDEPTSLKLAHLVLAAEGYQVTEAEAVGKAIEQILEAEPEAILLDLELPGTDGLTLTRWLKGDSQTRHIVIIALTAYPELFTREIALEAGCDAYIIKPINTRKLPQQVAQALVKSQ
jgi:CheY-like chemotaxis protein